MAKKKRLTSNTKSSPEPVIPTAAQETSLEWVLFAVVAIIVIYPLFFRALFFNRAMFVNHIIVALVFIGFWAVKWKRNDFRFIRTPLDWAALSLAVAYALSLITAVHFGEALYGCLKAFNYFMVYWLVGQVVNDHRGLERMTRVLLLGGVGVALIGILAASGFPIYPDAYHEGLIKSSLQYHNATAAFLAAMSVMGLALLTRENHRRWQIAYAMVTFLLLAVVFATVSKGAWLTLAMGGFILVLGIPGWRRLKAVYFLGGLGLVAFAVGNRFLAAVLGPQPYSGLILMAVGLVLAAVIYLLWESALYLIHNHHRGRLLVGGGSALLVLLIGGGLLLSGGLGLSKMVVRELLEIGQADNYSYITRLDFMRWGMSIVKDYPIFGAGAGGWDGLYHRYQDYLFWTKTVHSHFIEVWVEAGTIGFLSFIGIWLAMFWSLGSIYRQVREQISPDGAKPGDADLWIICWGCAATAVTMGLHASIDWDFSLPAMFLVWFILVAMINSAYIMTTVARGFSFSGWSAAALSVLLGIFILIMGSSALIAFQRAESGREWALQAYELEDRSDKKQALMRSARLYEKAINIYPWDGRYHSELAAVYAEQYSLAVSQGEEELDALYKQMLDSMTEADKLSPGDMVIQSQLLDAAALTNNFPLIMARLDRTVAANPLDIGNYEGRAELLWKAAEHAYKNGDKRAGEYCAAILQLPDEISKQQARLKPTLNFWQGDKLEITPTIALNLARVHYLQGHYEQSVLLLDTPYHDLMDRQERPEPLMSDIQAVYAASLRMQGKSQESRGVLEQAQDRAVKLYHDMMQWEVLEENA